jgi:hypothetical protein
VERREFRGRDEISEDGDDLWGGDGGGEGHGAWWGWKGRGRSMEGAGEAAQRTTFHRCEISGARRKGADVRGRTVHHPSVDAYSSLLRNSRDKCTVTKNVILGYKSSIV